MSNKDYLEKIRKAREKDLHDLDMSFDEYVDYPTKRIATALEIIAETLIKIKEHKEVRQTITYKKPDITFEKWEREG